MGKILFRRKFCILFRENNVFCFAKQINGIYRKIFAIFRKIVTYKIFSHEIPQKSVLRKVRNFAKRFANTKENIHESFHLTVEK